MTVGTEGILEKIKSHPHEGIPVDEVETRKNGFGSNAREKKPLRTIMEILCSVLEDFMLRILIVASIVTIIVNMIVEEDKAIGIFKINGSLD